MHQRVIMLILTIPTLLLRGMDIPAEQYGETGPMVIYLAFNGELVGRHFGYQSSQGCVDFEGPFDDFRSDGFIASFDISISVGLNDESMEEPPLIVKPNGDEAYQVLGLEAGTSWSIFDGLGRQVRRWESATCANSINVDLRSYPSGLYWLMCRGGQRSSGGIPLIRR